MSFYTSQVGKKSSRYNNSSLYGTNLSSVYADGPPPLDDSSTQDEDEDEMVFKDTKSLREHVTKDKELMNESDVKSSRDAQEVLTTADDDFGDFTSFADFSSAFGSTKTESNPSWFSTNGDCGQPAGTFLNSNQKDSPPGDDDFGCFSGGDESDFEGFKSFSDGNKEELNSNSISNGVRTYGTPAVFENKTPNRPDFFSDDDDDEFQAHNDETMNNSSQVSQTGFTSLDNPIGMQSTEMPSIFSDDDDDDFGEFSSSNYGDIPQKGTTHQLSMGESKKKEVNSSPTLESKYNSAHVKDNDSTSIQPINTEQTTHNYAIMSSANNQTLTTSSEGDSSLNNCSESSPSQKHSHVENQVSDLVDKCSLNETSIDSRDNDEFGDFGTKPHDKLSTSPEMNSSNNDFVKHSSMENSFDGEHKKLTSNEKENYSRDFIEVSTNVGDDNITSVKKELQFNDTFGDFSSIEQAIPNDTSDVKLATTCSQKTLQQQKEGTKNEVYERTMEDTENEFGDFSCTQSDKTFELSNSVSTLSNIQSKEESSDDLSIVVKSDVKSDQELSIDNLGNLDSGKENIDNFECAKVVNPTLSIQDDESGDISTVPSTCSAKPRKEGDDFGEYKSLSVDKQNDNSGTFATFDDEEEDEDFGDFGSSATPQSTLVQQNEQDDDCGNFAAFSNLGGTKDNTIGNGNDDDFGDFSSTPVTNNSLNNKENNTDNNFGNFATFSQDTEDNMDDDNDDDFGEFSVTPTVNNSLTNKENYKNDDFGNFTTSPNSGDTNFKDNGNDGDFGNFATFSSSEDTTSNDNVGDDNDNGNDDDFGDFSAKPTINNPLNNKESYKDDSFGNFSVGGNTGKSENNDDFGNFSEFSKFTSTTTQGSTPTENMPAAFTTVASTSDDFANFSSVKQPSKTPVQSSPSPTQKNSERRKSESIFQPQEHTQITVIGNLVKQGFVNVQTNVQENIITVVLQQEIQSGNPSVWQAVKGAERDGSLRFEWEGSDHKLKMLESLSMLPVRIQTSASFKSSGPVQTPLFASGLGLLEPVKGVITPFHHIEEVDPSQDPFAAPPEVGLPDLGFGGNNNASKKDASSGHVEVKDNMDSSSVSSSLDLDFLAPSGSAGDITKTEGKALYEDDLLGLGMQFSSESPKVFKSNRDHKIFKFNNTTVSLPTDDKNLSEQAKKIVNDFEDLSFMLSKALMFPLKSKE